MRRSRSRQMTRNFFFQDQKVIERGHRAGVSALATPSAITVATGV
jgi:hypothetical protein